ncbi:hypothetical protein AZE42_12474 [Rhizopogon vesiculosus]|uniref:Uncharacterized protein n=1 Tax=Rhizopogon vesiculosus TaxID=180088 RepID=A0A1J8RBQ2_9AGAM|nr:hypothetical protein AZE42_12474 [Rhizopogon vesiculosus]
MVSLSSSQTQLPPRDWDPSQDTFYPPLAFGDSFQHTLPSLAVKQFRDVHVGVRALTVS